MPKKKEPGWKNTCERFVAFLDIMGFKDMVLRKPHYEVNKLLESLQPDIRNIEHTAIIGMKMRKGQKSIEEQVQTRRVIRPVSFSDSIILISVDNSFLSAVNILLNTGWIFQEAITKGLPMKGAIAYGEMTVDIENSLYFGKPLIDAYELHKEFQIYGVGFHHTAQERFDLEKEELLYGLVAEDYSVPIQSRKTTHHLLDWTMFCENPENSVKKLYNSVSGSTRLYVDNTLKFVREISQKKAELEAKEKQAKK